MHKLIMSFRVQLETNHIKGDNVSVHMKTPYNQSLVIKQVIYNCYIFCKFQVMLLFSWMF